MYTKFLLSIATAAGTVSASPLWRRQSSAVVTESVTSTASVASTPGLTPTASVSSQPGGASYPLYPCPAGTFVTYSQTNQTISAPIDAVKMQIGEFATSVVFPNVSASTGASDPGATHTYNIMGANYQEVLVNSTAGSTDSAFVQWVYNSTAPVMAGALTIASYQSVFKAYDPNFSTLGARSNETTVQIFTNACSADQAAAMMALQSLQSSQLNLITGDRSMNGTGSNGGGLITSTVATNTVSTTNTNTAVATNTVNVTSTNAVTATNTDTAIATNTVAVTNTNDVTQTNTLVPVTASTTGVTVQETTTPLTMDVTSTAATVMSTAATELQTTTAATQDVTSVAATVQSTAATTLVTSMAPSATDTNTVVVSTTTAA